MRPCRWAADGVKLRLRLRLGAQMSEGRSLTTEDEYAVHGCIALIFRICSQLPALIAFGPMTRRASIIGIPHCTLP